MIWFRGSEDCSRITSSDILPGPFRGYFDVSKPIVPLQGRDEPLQETVDGDSASLNCYNELYIVELSCLWTLPPCWPSMTSQPPSSCTAWPVFSALVLRSTNAFCIESCKKAAQMSLVIFARRIWLSWKLWV